MATMLPELWLGLKLLLVLAAANVAPILAKRWLGARWSLPLDAGAVFFDGRRLLGPSKTVRGVVAAALAGTLAALMLGLSPLAGLWMGLCAMAGDALSSFIKRRLAIPPSGKATGLDQLPEALLPLVAVQPLLELTPELTLGVALAFFLLEMPLARWSFRRGLRDRPY